MQLSKNAFPPGGWQFFQPETKWFAPPNGSFNLTVDAIRKMRMNNPGKGLATGLEAVEDDLMRFTIVRVNAIHPGYFSEPAQVKKKLTPFRGIVNRIRDRVVRLAGGAEILRDWVGSGEPVIQELANQRAIGCALKPCPMNKGGGALGVVTGAVAEAVKQQMELKHHLKLETPSDSLLQSCSACDCDLKLKVWVPIGTILKRTAQETLDRLHPDCWILAEKKSPGY